MLGDGQVLADGEGQVGDCEAARLIIAGAEGNHACRGGPLALREGEGDGELEIGGVGALTVAVQSVVAGKDGVPCRIEEAEVVSGKGFEDMAGGMGVVQEIAGLGAAGPLVGDAEGELAEGVGSGKVNLSGVVGVGKTHTSPC